MQQIQFLTGEQMNQRLAAIQADLTAIGATLEEKLTVGDSRAQAKRLVALAMAKQVEPMLGQIAQAAQFLTPPKATEAAEEEPTAGDNDGQDLFANLFKMAASLAEGVAEEIADMYGVDAQAIGPFLVETNSVMLVVAEDLINRAKQALAEADAISV